MSRYRPNATRDEQAARLEAMTDPRSDLDGGIDRSPCPYWGAGDIGGIPRYQTSIRPTGSYDPVQGAGLRGDSSEVSRTPSPFWWAL